MSSLLYEVYERQLLTVHESFELKNIETIEPNKWMVGSEDPVNLVV